MVTLTDHNTIEGVLEIAHLPDVFVSEEVTTYFPEDGCKIHVLAFDINEQQHREIQRVRPSVFDLVEFLKAEGIVHAIAHPLYSTNDLMNADHFEQLLLLFKNFELNGARDESQNRILKGILGNLRPGIWKGFRTNTALNLVFRTLEKKPHGRFRRPQFPQYRLQIYGSECRPNTGGISWKGLIKATVFPMAPKRPRSP
jgi:hypothetical protein